MSTSYWFYIIPVKCNHLDSKGIYFYFQIAYSIYHYFTIIDTEIPNDNLITQRNLDVMIAFTWRGQCVIGSNLQIDMVQYGSARRNVIISTDEEPRTRARRAPASTVSQREFRLTNC